MNEAAYHGMIALWCVVSFLHLEFMRDMTKQSAVSPVFAALMMFAFALCSGPVAAKEAQSHYEIVQTTLDKHLLPHFEDLRAAAEYLPDKVSKVCQTGDDGAREVLDSALHKAVLAWAGVAYIRFGPLSVVSRRERLSFWPDPRGIVNRQLRQLIASNDPAAAAAGTPCSSLLKYSVPIPSSTPSSSPPS